MHSTDPPICRRCKCGNVVVSGNHFSRIYKTGLSETIQNVVAHNTEPLIQIRSMGIAIDQPDQMAFQKQSDVQCSIYCLKCQDSLIMYLGRGLAFAQFKRFGPKSKPQFSSAFPVQRSPSASSIPRPFRGLIMYNESHEDTYAQNDDDDEGDAISPLPQPELMQEEDDDFDIMFSNTRDPVVGSYTESSMAMTFI